MLVHYLIPLLRSLMYFLAYSTLTVIGIIVLYIAINFLLAYNDMRRRVNMEEFDDYDDL